MFAFVVVVISLMLIGAVVFFLRKKIQEKVEEESSGIDEKESKVYTTQNRLPFEFIRGGVVALKDGTYSKVLEVSSINTQLMEPDEQEIVRAIWGGILDSLNFEIQILRQSRIVDIAEYLDGLKERMTTEESEDRRRHLYTYHTFMSRLIEENSLQTKRNYIVIPYREKKEKKGRFEEVDEMKKYRKDGEKIEYEEEQSERRFRFERAKKTLTQRASVISKSLRRLEITSEELDDEELLKLYYTAYNKERSNYQSLERISPEEYTSLFVKTRGEDR